MEGLGFGVVWSGVDATENGAKLLSLLATSSMIEVPSVLCLQVFGKASTAVGANAFKSGSSEYVLPCLIPLGQC
ncbi:hypothetical protein AMTR_s00100p00050270 [Amborella trichopoda]|uniref:Uncharacterized protein n=1 Tax=Amborella trichopoda TaxID=13333 RepID=W1NYF0_AMBTC|nr:hypothetical protein AMTR_s00100p00050270 [Amborella trichopoda]